MYIYISVPVTAVVSKYWNRSLFRRSRMDNSIFRFRIRNYSAHSDRRLTTAHGRNCSNRVGFLFFFSRYNNIITLWRFCNIIVFNCTHVDIKRRVHVIRGFSSVQWRYGENIRMGRGAEYECADLSFRSNLEQYYYSAPLNT